MSKVEIIEAELQKLSPAEVREVRIWLDDFLAAQPEFTESHFLTLREDVAAGAAQVAAGKVSPFDEAATARIKRQGQDLLKRKRD